MSRNPAEITRNTYDKIAADYIVKKEKSKIWALANYIVVRNFTRRLPKSSRGGILVVGPAGGHTSIKIAKTTSRFVRGVDFSKSMVAEANRLKQESEVTNCSFEVGDITKIRLGAKYDGILCDGVLYHISREKIPALLRKLHASLTPGGVLYANFKKGQGFELQQDPVTYPGSPRAYWFYGVKELEQLFENAGFRAVVKTNRTPMFGEYFIEVTAKLG